MDISPVVETEAKKEITDFNPGDTLKVKMKVIEVSVSAARPLRELSSGCVGAAPERTSL